MDPTSQNTNSKELAHINEEIYKKNKELAEKNKALSLLRKIDEIILSKVTDIQQIAQQVANTIADELGFKLVAILLLDKKDNGLIKLAVSQTDPIMQTEIKLNQALFGVKIPLIDDNNLIVRAIGSQRMQLTHGLNDILTPHFTEEQSKIAQELIGITASFIYPLIVRGEIIGAMVVSINEKEGLSDFKNDLIDRLAGVIGIAIDNALLYLAIQAANERLKGIDRLKDEFVSLASHELRTPMTIIKSYLWMILEKEGTTLSEKQKIYIDRAYTSTQRLINLVNDMLNVSRIESGRLTLAMKSVDITELINTIYLEMLPKAQEQKINLEFVKPAEGLPNVQADPERIEQILINLVGNSLKFTEEGQSIKISLTNNPSDKTVIISVADNGKGIGKEDLPKLFQKFGMIGKDYLIKQNSQGTGLGLYISKSLVELHGGKIWAESEGEGKGSRFSFTLKTV
ncbi:MAG: GAF domain-containing sensor histidine kinase [Patescibacteria group bacterium]